MIRRNPLAVTLVTMLFLCALLTCWFAAWSILGGRELRNLEAQYQAMNRTSSAVQSLASEALEFSRKHPAIDPILQRYELKPKAQTSVTPPASAQPRPAR